MMVRSRFRPGHSTICTLH